MEVCIHLQRPFVARQENFKPFSFAFSETIPTPAFFPSENGITNDIITMPESDNYIPKILMATILAVAIFIL